MQGLQRPSKIVYTDGGQDKGVTGKILGEDEFFIEIYARSGHKLRIAKSRIVSIKEREHKGA